MALFYLLALKVLARTHIQMAEPDTGRNLGFSVSYPFSYPCAVDRPANPLDMAFGGLWGHLALPAKSPIGHIIAMGCATKNEAEIFWDRHKKCRMGEETWMLSVIKRLLTVALVLCVIHHLVCRRGMGREIHENGSKVLLCLRQWGHVREDLQEKQRQSPVFNLIQSHLKIHFRHPFPSHSTSLSHGTFSNQNIALTKLTCFEYSTDKSH